MKSFFKFFALLVLSAFILLLVVDCSKEKKTEEPQPVGQSKTTSDLGQTKEPEKTKEVILPGLKPTVGGGDFAESTNCLHVKAGEKKNEVEFWREKKGEPGYFFVIKGGKFWGGTVAQEDGFVVCFKGVHVTVDSDTGFVGNLDYENSSLTFIGTVVLMKHTFASDEKEPLVFKLVKDKGAVYVEGKGTVMTPEGEKTNLGSK